MLKLLLNICLRIHLLDLSIFFGVNKIKYFFKKMQTRSTNKNCFIITTIFYNWKTFFFLWKKMDDEFDELNETLEQEDCWKIISAFFLEKGLVRQQLDSFNEFVENTMQEIVNENASLVLQTAQQHSGEKDDQTV